MTYKIIVHVGFREARANTSKFRLLAKMWSLQISVEEMCWFLKQTTTLLLKRGKKRKIKDAEKN